MAVQSEHPSQEMLVLHPAEPLLLQTGWKNSAFRAHLQLAGQLVGWDSWTGQRILFHWIKLHEYCYFQKFSLTSVSQKRSMGLGYPCFLYPSADPSSQKTSVNIPHPELLSWMHLCLWHHQKTHIRYKAKEISSILSKRTKGRELGPSTKDKNHRGQIVSFTWKYSDEPPPPRSVGTSSDLQENQDRKSVV